MSGDDVGVDTPTVPFPPTVPGALRHAVAHWGDHDFIVTPDRRMTYAEAEAESRAVAKQMLAAGMGKGTRVGLYFTYGQEWVVAWLAASRIGALVMPLATTYRPAEIRQVLRIGDIDTLITARWVLGHDMQQMLEASVPGLAESSGRQLYLADAPFLRAVWITGDTDASWATSIEFGAESDVDIDDTLLRAIEAEVVPGDLAQVTYTSGSSADPKGVVHTHGTVVRGTYAFGRPREPPTPPPRFFCAFPFFWIGGTLILGAALQSGATVLVHRAFRAGAALDLVEAEQATHVLGWPTLLQSMRDHPSFADRTLPDIAGLTVGPADVALVESPVPGIPAHRGMSETVGNIRRLSTGWSTPRPGAVPDGEEGELWVRGHGLMHGYYKKERVRGLRRRRVAAHR